MVYSKLFNANICYNAVFCNSQSQNVKHKINKSNSSVHNIYGHNWFLLNQMCYRTLYNSVKHTYCYINISILDKNSEIESCQEYKYLGVIFILVEQTTKK